MNNINCNPLISIVVPVYNVEQYLEKCVESLIRQTYSNIEIILIDDGSVDESGKICDKYGDKYNNIIVVHQTNKGLSGARNSGIEISKGDYIAFVDSDDFVTDNYIEYLYDLLKKYEADISMCSNYKFFEGEKLHTNEKKIKIKIKQFTAEEALEDLLYRKNITAYACGKLFKKELFKEVCFPERQLFEDLSTIYKLLDRCKKVCWSSAENYYYLQRKNSIVNSEFNTRKLSVVDTGIEICEFIKEKYPDILGAAISKVFISSVDMYRRIPNKESYGTEKDYLRRIINSYKKIVFEDKKNKPLTRCIAFVACINVNILKSVCKFYTFLGEKLHIQFKKPV